MPLDADLATELDALQRIDRLRSVHPVAGKDRTHPARRSLAFTSFASNDYLGLASDPRLADAAAAAARNEGYGAAASRLLTGETPSHLALEEQLASLTGLSAALLFPTGYQANLGVLTALLGSDDLVVSDAANHASIIDGCRLSRARIAVYAHADPDAAREALATSGRFRRRVLVTESLFSMDGDRAPLPDLLAAARDADALLVVDEAHALGVAGPDGRGICAEHHILPDALIGTLGKAFGGIGGFVAGSTTLRSYLINRARTFIFTTAPPPPVAAAATAGIGIALGPEGQHLRTRAYANARVIRTTLAAHGMNLPGHDLILPWIVGSDAAALSASQNLEKQGILAPAVRPPTVPPGTARLRLAVSAKHTDQDVGHLAAALLSSLTLPPSP